MHALTTKYERAQARLRLCASSSQTTAIPVSLRFGMVSVVCHNFVGVDENGPVLNVRLHSRGC